MRRLATQSIRFIAIWSYLKVFILHKRTCTHMYLVTAVAAAAVVIAGVVVIVVTTSSLQFQ